MIWIKWTPEQKSAFLELKIWKLNGLEERKKNKSFLEFW